MNNSTLVTLLIAAILIGLGIGLSIWSRNRLLQQGKIIKRPRDFMEYAEIFTLRPLPVQEFTMAMGALNQKETGAVLGGNPDCTTFTVGNKLSTLYTAKLVCIARNPGNTVYRFEFCTWKTSHGNATYADQMNVLLTKVEQMFLRLDPNTQVSSVHLQTKRSFI